jgi:hypothetical protein
LLSLLKLGRRYSRDALEFIRGRKSPRIAANFVEFLGTFSAKRGLISSENYNNVVRDSAKPVKEDEI